MSHKMIAEEAAMMQSYLPTKTARWLREAGRTPVASSFEISDGQNSENGTGKVGRR
jgi:hypothetical protein